MDRTCSRRGFFALGVGAFVVAAAPIAVARRGVLVRRTVPLMGTLAELAVVASGAPAAQDAIDAALAALLDVETTMSRFSAVSDVGRANAGAAREGVAVTPATARVLQEAIAWAEASDGAFDPALGRASRVWDVAHRQAPPDAREVRPLAGRRFYRALDIARWRAEPALRFTNAHVEVDLGGIAKGYGVDRAVAELRRRGIARALVNVGGDLYALGEADTGTPWRVGIQSPTDPGRLAGGLMVADGAVATSGDYLQFFTHGGRRYHHLLDPATAAPYVTDVHSVTVTADTCMAADAAATTVYGMTPERVARVLGARPGRPRIARVIGGEADPA